MVTTADAYFGFSMVSAKNIFRLISCSSCIKKRTYLNINSVTLKHMGEVHGLGCASTSITQPALQKLKKTCTSLLQTQKASLSNC